MLEDEQHHAQADQQQARDVERKTSETDEREDDRESPCKACDVVRVIDLEQQAVEAEREQDERDVRITQKPEQALDRAHRLLLDGRPAECEGDLSSAGEGDRATVGKCDQFVGRPCHAVDGVRRKRLLGRVRLCVRDGRNRPVDVPAARLGDSRDVGDRVVLDFLAQRPGDVLTVAVDRGGRSDVRAGSHHGEGAGKRDERPCARRSTA